MKTVFGICIGFTLGIAFVVIIRTNTGWNKDHIVTPETKIEIIDGKSDTTYIYKMY